MSRVTKFEPYKDYYAVFIDLNREGDKIHTYTQRITSPSVAGCNTGLGETLEQFSDWHKSLIELELVYVTPKAALAKLAKIDRELAKLNAKLLNLAKTANLAESVNFAKAANSAKLLNLAKTAKILLNNMLVNEGILAKLAMTKLTVDRNKLAAHLFGKLK